MLRLLASFTPCKTSKTYHHPNVSFLRIIFLERGIEVQEAVDGENLRHGQSLRLFFCLCNSLCNFVKHPFLCRGGEAVDHGGDIQRDVGALGDVVSDDVSPAF